MTTISNDNINGIARRWMYGLVPQGIAIGLSNLLMLLFLVTNLKGGIFDIGILAGASALTTIPALMFWGWLTDRLGRYRPFLVLSFIGVGVILLLIPTVHSVYELFVLRIAKSFLYSASMPSRQILTVESENHVSWHNGLSRLQFVQIIGETMGLGIGFLAIGHFGVASLFAFCGLLSFASAFASVVWMQDPSFLIERRLLGIERFAGTLIGTANFMCNPGLFSGTLGAARVASLSKPGIKFFMVGVFCFSLGAAALYTPLPAYFLGFYAPPAVFLLFFAGTLGNAMCYLIVPRFASRTKTSLLLAAGVRMSAIPILALQGGNSGFAVSIGALAIMGGIWALYDVSSTCTFLGFAQMGRAGIYGAIGGLGAAAGGFLGGSISAGYGFDVLFISCILIYLTALAAFILHFKS